MVMTENKVKEIFQSEFTNLFESNKEYFFNLFSDFFTEMLEDKGMLLALKEIKEEDADEVAPDELDAIFKGDFIKEK